MSSTINFKKHKWIDQAACHSNTTFAGATKVQKLLLKYKCLICLLPFVTAGQLWMSVKLWSSYINIANYVHYMPRIVGQEHYPTYGFELWAFGLLLMSLIIELVSLIFGARCGALPCSNDSTGRARTRKDTDCLLWLTAVTLLIGNGLIVINAFKLLANLEDFVAWWPHLPNVIKVEANLFSISVPIYLLALCARLCLSSSDSDSLSPVHQSHHNHSNYALGYHMDLDVEDGFLNDSTTVSSPFISFMEPSSPTLGEIVQLPYNPHVPADYEKQRGLPPYEIAVKITTPTASAPSLSINDVEIENYNENDSLGSSEKFELPPPSYDEVSKMLN